MRHGDPPYTPTPEQIRVAARNIRYGWTEEEERRHRAGGVAKPLTCDPIPDSVFDDAMWSEART
jgi:hypothetical protein